MLWFINHVFIMLLSSGRCLATKGLCLSNEQCMTRPTPINLNPIEVNYYPFLISFDKCNAGLNAVDDLSTKRCVPKDLNVKIFNMRTKINEAKTFIKHISCNCKSTFDITTFNSNKKCSN